MKGNISAVHIRAINMRASRGLLMAGGMTIPCVLGRSGRVARKREGDGATPVGQWSFGRLHWRADRMGLPAAALRFRPLRPSDGWCDDPQDRNYNRPVQLPYPASHEELWRQDGLYDLIIELSHNRRPRVRHLGSAVFFHVAGQDGETTAGCVAVRKSNLKRLLPLIGPKTRLVVEPVSPRSGVRK